MWLRFLRDLLTTRLADERILIDNMWTHILMEGQTKERPGWEPSEGGVIGNQPHSLHSSHPLRQKLWKSSPTIPDIEPARCQAELRERDMNMAYEVNII